MSAEGRSHATSSEPSIKRSDLELRSVDAGKHRHRRYHIAECESLFGEPALLIAWGRIGAPARVRVEAFANLATRTARYEELLARRHAHGYDIAG